MPHQCTKCSKVYPDAAEELLNGCECGSRFFYYIRQEKYDDLQKEVKQVLEELDRADKEQIEQDIRELTGLGEKPDEPVILDLESVRVIKPGKFEIDIVNLFNKNRPLIYKLEEGKYIIDLASSLKVDKDKVNSKIKNPFVSIGSDSTPDDLDEEDEDSDDESETDDGKEVEKEIVEEDKLVEDDSDDEIKEIVEKDKVVEEDSDEEEEDDESEDSEEAVEENKVDEKSSDEVDDEDDSDEEDEDDESSDEEEEENDKDKVKELE
jgi:predicted  nucleic acid-binding Zn-ribbon protein